MTRDLYSEITNRIVADMESGVLPWEKSWDGKERGSMGIPTNALSQRPYRGINIMLLWGAAMLFDAADMRFVTYKQAQEAGGSVKKGEKGHPIVFYKPLTITDKTTEEEKTIPMLRGYTVFHVSQTEGCSFPTMDTSAPELPDDVAEFASSLSMKLAHGGDKACYIPSADQVLMPYPQDFKTIEAYRATLYHETTHWTGAKHRLDRDQRNSFGTRDYAYEELIAELGGAFLCAEFGMSYQTQHASYLSSWIKKLQDDKRAIFKAASAAQKAVDFIRAEILAAPEQMDEAA